MVIDTAIVGAGPYGLSMAAHFRHQGIPHRIFGYPMDSWLSHMPKEMLLKSEGFASNLYDPEGEFPLKTFCAERGIEYADEGLPVRLETFAAYGLAFRERMAPDLEEKLVARLDRISDAFLITLENGETITARKVVLAVGITHFEYVPANLAGLPPKFFSHSFHHHDLERFRDRRVVVVGGGASALDLAGLLRDCAADVHLVARARALEFHKPPSDKPRSWWDQIRYPKSGLGPGPQSRFYANAPGVFHYLPERLRRAAVQRSHGPAGGWFIREKVEGRVPLLLGCTIKGAVVNFGKVSLQLSAENGAEREILADHVIAATGYRVDLERLSFLTPGTRRGIKTTHGSPVLSSSFESSVPGLYFVGIAAANGFGPVMRFAFGAGYAAHTVTQAMLESLARSPGFVAAPSVASSS